MASAWSVWSITCKYSSTHSAYSLTSPPGHCGFTAFCVCLSGRELIRSSGDSLRLLVAKIDSKTSSKGSATTKCWRKSRGVWSSAIGNTGGCLVHLSCGSQRFSPRPKENTLPASPFRRFCCCLRKERWDNRPEQQDGLTELFGSDRWSRLVSETHFAVPASSWLQTNCYRWGKQLKRLQRWMSAPGSDSC